jgi:hypothetical protein
MLGQLLIEIMGQFVHVGDVQQDVGAVIELRILDLFSLWKTC